MSLSKAAILALKGMNKEQKDRIAESAGISHSSLLRWIQTKDDSLTKAAVLRAISAETGLDNSQLLEEVSTEEAAN